MHYLLTLMLLAQGLIQITQDTKQQNPTLPKGDQSAPAVKKKEAPAGKPAADKAAQPGKTALPEEPETKWDKEIKAAADKVDAIPYVTAKIRQQVFVIDRRTVVNGEYKKGPNQRVKFILTTNMPGGAASEKVTSCDGKTARMYASIGDNEQLSQLKLDEVMDLAQRKVLDDAFEKALKSASIVPSMSPSALLRGFFANFTFTNSEKGVLEGSRAVIRYDGHWKQAQIAQFNNGQPSTDIESVGPIYFPQFVRVYLDEKTNWPLKVEMYRKDRYAEFKPQYTLEFLEVSFPASIPDSEFSWTPPKTKKSDAKVPLEAQDITPMILASLKKMKDKPNASGGGASEAIETIKKPPEKKQ